MNIQDIKNILLDNRLKNIILKGKKPHLLSINKKILKDFCADFKLQLSEVTFLLKNKNNLDNIHIFCPVCGNKNNFISYNQGYRKHCSQLCGAYDTLSNQKRSSSHKNLTKEKLQLKNKKRKITCLKKYGREFAQQSDIVKNKIKNTCLKKYNVIANGLSKNARLKYKNTMFERYGSENPFKSDIIKNKIKIAFLKKYNVCTPFESKIIQNKSKKTFLNKYGVDNYSKTKQYKDLFNNKKWVSCTQQKIYNTKKKNSSFNISKPEDECYGLLLTKFNKDDIAKQYESDLYPFNCDFYIKSLNLYIECNFHWTHGNQLKAFDKNNIEHIEQLEKWKSKNTKFYDNAIKVWTIKDPLKLETFKKNNLNYKIFYNIKEFIEWFKNI